MAFRYWVGGSGDWNNGDTSHWSTVSSGPGGASVPTTADIVIIDSNSWLGGGTFTITVTGTAGTNIRPCNSINISSTTCIMVGSLTPTLTISGTTAGFSGLTVGTSGPGALNVNCIAATPVTFTATSNCSFNGNITVSNIKWRGAVLGSSFYTLTVNGTMEFADTGQSVTISCGRFVGNSGLTSITTSGYSFNVIQVSAESGTVWDTSAATSLSIPVADTFSVSLTAAPATGFRVVNCPGPNNFTGAIGFNITPGNNPAYVVLQGNASNASIPFICKNLYIVDGSSNANVRVASHNMLTYGSVTLGSTIPFTFTNSSGTNNWTIYNNNNPTIILSNTLGTILKTITVDGASNRSVTFSSLGTVNLPDGALKFNTGTINASSTFFVKDVQITTTAGAVFNLLSSTWYIGNGTWDNSTTPGNVTINASTSNIVLNGNTGSTFRGGGATYSTLRFGAYNTTYTVTGNNTFSNISYSNEGFPSVPTKLVLPAGGSTVVNNFLVSGGSNAARATIESSSLGTPSVINSSSAASNTVTYANLNSISATGTTTQYRTADTSVDAFTTGFALLGNGGSFFFL